MLQTCQPQSTWTNRMCLHLTDTNNMSIAYHFQQLLQVNDIYFQPCEYAWDKLVHFNSILQNVPAVHTTFYAGLFSFSLHAFLYHCITTDPTAVQNWNHVTCKTAAISLNYEFFLFCLISFDTCNCYCTVHMNDCLGGLC